jgi:hypothetical protein
MEDQARRPTITPDQILKVMSMPDVMTPERLAFARDLSSQLASDPELLASIGRILQANASAVKRMDFASEQLETFGWARDDETLKAMPSPQQAAAAAAAGVAAMAAGAAAAVVA